MHHTDKHSQHSSIILPVWLNGRVFIYELSACGFGSLKLQISLVLSKDFLDIQATIECRFTLKHVCDMIKTCSQTQVSSHNTVQSG